MSASYVVIGLGSTGLSCVRYLESQGKSVVVMDTRQLPPNLQQFRQDYPQIPVYTGEDWPQDILDKAKALVVSPGIALSTPAIEKAKHKGVEILGDIELFARQNKAPVIAITGANGKSTVTTLVGEMARAAGKKVAVIGNIGEPVLNALAKGAPAYDFVVMELSSFQLETTAHLNAVAATVLNITPDHMDRYPTLADYVSAKHRIYHHAENVIINKQDSLTDSEAIPATAKRWYFTMQAPIHGEFGVRTKAAEQWLAWGEEDLIAVSEMKIMGEHNIANALSALALGHAAGLAFKPMLETLRHFKGLSHRCQLVAEKNGIRWINDSKGTNIGATLAALKGIGPQIKGKIVLLLGGDGKGADFTELSPIVSQYCRAIIVMGKDAPSILTALEKQTDTFKAETMEQAVKLAAHCVSEGDVVLLSPACSSLDQYKDFNHRGEVFIEAVNNALALSS